jgi:competence protein ComEC
MSTTKNKQGIVAAIALLLLVTTVLWQVIYTQRHQGTLTLAFLDVGQGDAIFIESPTGTQVLIDGGRDSGVLRELAQIMPFYDRSIDIVVASHPDTDHVGGLVGVLERFTVRYILRPGVAHDAPAAESLLLNIAHQKGVGAVEVLARRGQVYDLGGGALLHVLFPDREVSGLESNTASVILRLEYGETSVMLTGDSPDSIEEYMYRSMVQRSRVTSLSSGTMDLRRVVQRHFLVL